MYFKNSIIVNDSLVNFETRKLILDFKMIQISFDYQ